MSEEGLVGLAGYSTSVTREEMFTVAHPGFIGQGRRGLAWVTVRPGSGSGCEGRLRAVGGGEGGAVGGGNCPHDVQAKTVAAVVDGAGSGEPLEGFEEAANFCGRDDRASRYW